MGIKNLNKFLKKKCKNGIVEISLKELKGEFIGIDTSIFLYKYSYMGDMLKYFLKQIEHLLKNNITPIYLFDGKPTEDKRDTINKRKETYNKNKNNIEELKNKKEELLENSIDLEEIEEELKNIQKEIDKKTKNNVKVDFVEVLKFKEILKNLGIFYYDCDGETDSYIKSFFDEKLINYVITEDLDFLTHGCKNVISKYNHSKTKVSLYNMEKILKDIDLEHESFIDFCIILGCDYHEKGIKNIGPVKGYNLIKKYKNLKNILDNEETIEEDEEFNYENILNMFKCIKDLNLTKDNVKIDKKKLNIEYFNEIPYNMTQIINLIKNFKYKSTINILSYMKK